MYTHKKAHKWVWGDWWDFKKLLEGISLGLFPTAPQCQSQSRRRDGSSKGRKKKYTPTAASQLKLNPFNYSPEVEAWGAKKKLSSILLQERETPLPLLKYPLMHSLHEAVWMCKFEFYITPNWTQRVHNGSKKEQVQSLTCVLRAYGLCYLSPIHAVLLIHNNPPSGATPKVRRRHKQINKGIERERDKKKNVALRERAAMRSWIS